MTRMFRPVHQVASPGRSLPSPTTSCWLYWQCCTLYILGEGGAMFAPQDRQLALIGQNLSTSTRHILSRRCRDWAFRSRLQSYGGLKFFPKCSSPYDESILQIQKSRDAKMLLTCSIIVPSLIGLGLRTPPGGGGNVGCLVLLVYHAFERQSFWTPLRHAEVGVQDQCWYRWIEEGLYLCSPFNCISLPLGGATNMVKFGVSFIGDRIN